jgi:hypothetical protein
MALSARQFSRRQRYAQACLSFWRLRARLSHMCGVGSVRRLCAFRALSHGVLSESGRAGIRTFVAGLKSVL